MARNESEWNWPDLILDWGTFDLVWPDPILDWETKIDW
jgi:hypothetical protein